MFFPLTNKMCLTIFVLLIEDATYDKFHIHLRRSLFTLYIKSEKALLHKLCILRADWERTFVNLVKSGALYELHRNCHKHLIRHPRNYNVKHFLVFTSGILGITAKKLMKILTFISEFSHSLWITLYLSILTWLEGT